MQKIQLGFPCFHTFSSNPKSFIFNSLQLMYVLVPDSTIVGIHHTITQCPTVNIGQEGGV